MSALALSHVRRDRDESLAPLRFLFVDYRGQLYWFEVSEMYRRTLFNGALPILVSDPLLRAAGGSLLAMLSTVQDFSLLLQRTAFRPSLLLLLLLATLPPLARCVHRCKRRQKAKRPLFVRGWRVFYAYPSHVLSVSLIFPPTPPSPSFSF